MSKGKVKQYYDTFDEWARLDSPAGALELLRTLSILERYLHPPAHLLDLGGGPGRYAIALAQQGFQVSLADLSPALLNTAKERIQHAGVGTQIDSLDEVDATDLSLYQGASFDAVLSMGPFYHLTEQQDRKRAAEELVRVLKPGGTAIVAFIPHLTGIKGLIDRASTTPHQVSAEVFTAALKTEIFHNPTPQGFQEGYYPTSSKIEALFRSAGLKPERILSVRGLAFNQEEALWRIAETDNALFEQIMRAIAATESQPSVIDSGGHALFIGTKPPIL